MSTYFKVTNTSNSLIAVGEVAVSPGQFVYVNNYSDEVRVAETAGLLAVETITDAEIRQQPLLAMDVGDLTAKIGDVVTAEVASQINQFTSGYSGFSGVDGQSGYSGTDGASGYSGADGASGYSGADGASGYSGFSGAVTEAAYCNPATCTAGDIATALINAGLMAGS